MKQWFIGIFVALLIHETPAEEGQASPADKQNCSYDSVDMNADGTIALWELLAHEKRQALKKGKQFDIESTKELFALLDTDHSKSISREEFEFLKHYTSLPEKFADSDK